MDTNIFSLHLQEVEMLDCEALLTFFITILDLACFNLICVKAYEIVSQPR